MSSESTEKINAALTLLNEAARDKKDELSSLLEGKYDSLKQAVLHLESEVEEKARRGFSKTCEMAHEVKEKAERVDQKVHEDPWKTLTWTTIGAFVIGFLIGHKD
jgi:ElaB/YqjD/DUF883 family membrane-anchored ribosome-binding protein